MTITLWQFTKPHTPGANVIGYMHCETGAGPFTLRIELQENERSPRVIHEEPDHDGYSVCRSYEGWKAYFLTNGWVRPEL